MITEFARATGISQEELLGRNRRDRLCDARQLYWRLMKKNGYTVTRIANLCDRDHSSIVTGIQHVEHLLETGDRLVAEWNRKTKNITRYSE
jgi:chromosomal replication initiation ATPase DnaA